MITAKEARKRAEGVHEAREREYENKVAELWGSWKQDIVKAIEENSAKGEFSCALSRGGKSDDEQLSRTRSHVILARHLIAINSSYAGCLATLTI